MSWKRIFEKEKRFWRYIDFMILKSNDSSYFKNHIDENERY
jgi:hypothetical protein